MGIRIAVGVFAVAATLACYCFGSGDSPTPTPTPTPTPAPGRAGIIGDALASVGEVARRDAGIAAGIASARVREADLRTLPIVRREASSEAPAEARCRVLLVGLLPGLPWRTPLEWRFRSGQRLAKLERTVDAHGRSFLALPDRAEQLESLHFRAMDPAYRLVQVDRVSLRPGKTLAVAVEPIGSLRGAVIGPDGVGLRAQVRAFRWLPSGRLGPLVAATQAGRYGYFALRVPAAVEVRVVAEMAVFRGAIHGQVPGLLLEFEEDLAGGGEDEFSGADQYPSDTRFLPAQLVASCRQGESLQLGTLRLRTPSVLSGRLVTANGRGVGRAQVFAYPANRTTAGRYDKLQLVASGVVARGACAYTDRLGHFTLQLAPDMPFVVCRVADHTELVPTGSRVFGSAPGYVELVAR